MLELVFVACVVLYLALSVGVVVLVGKWAKKHGRRRWPWCTAIGVFMYLLVAWDQIPTFLISEYYCATRAGVEIYKTPAQWKVENPRIAEILTWKNIAPQENVGGREYNVSLNERFVGKYREKLLDFIPVGISTQEIVDISNDEVVVRYVGIRAGYGFWKPGAGWRKLKFWVFGRHCSTGWSDYMANMMLFKELGRRVEK